MPRGKSYTVDDVLTGLHLCGEGYHDGACERCPFLVECESDALFVAAEHQIRKLQEELAEAKKKLETLTAAAGDPQ